MELLLGIVTRFDPALDVQFTAVKLDGITPIYRGVMGIDCTMKTGYPDSIEMDSDIKLLVDRRWGEYWA